MSGDALVYDFANTTDSQSSVFLKKNWLSIIDDNTTNYAGNQVTINTSAISNSNRYCDFRQGYLQIPLLYTLLLLTQVMDLCLLQRQNQLITHSV